MTIDEAFKFRKERENSLREIATKVKIEAIEKELKKYIDRQISTP